MSEHRGEQRGEQRRVTIAEAAELLGISKDAVRMRASRGTLRSERAGRSVYVWVSTDQGTGQNAVRPDVPNELLTELRDRVRFLEGQLEIRTEELKEHRRLLAAALERMPPQLEAPSEAPGAPGTAAEGSEPRPGATDTQEHDADTLRSWTSDVEARPRPQEGAQRPWWRRMFGG